MIIKLFALLAIIINFANSSLAQDFNNYIDIVSDGQHKPIITFKLKPGYKVYYEYPGLFGASPVVKYQTEKLDLIYSTPRRFNINGFDMIGYHNQAFFIIDKLLKIGSNIDLEYAICQQNCSLETQSVKIRKINTQQYNDLLSSNFLTLIKPHKQVLEIELTTIDQKIFLTPINNNKIQDIIIHSTNFVSKRVKNNQWQLLYSGNIEQAIDKLMKQSPKILFINQDNTSRIHPVIYKFSTLSSNKFNIFYLLSLAFFGGIILNFMPCIFPLITLKAYACIKQQNRSELAWQIIGIISSMIVIAGIQIIAKESGKNFILGSQFTNSHFIIITSFIITIAILISTDSLTIPIPRLVNHALNQKYSNYLANLAQGFFITLIATPCSAPILGLALGASLTATAQQTLLIFIFIGLGLSLPYILLLFSPQLINIFLPKPGKWLSNFKSILVGSLVVFNLWLIYILYSQAGLELAVKVIIAQLLLILFTGAKNNLTKGSISFILVILALNLLTTQYQNYQEKIASEWIKFDENLLHKYIKEDKVVFVDITASWCITCQYNHLTTLNTNHMKNFFQKNNIILMRGDLSKRDENVINFLNKYQRAGIPFNAFFYKDILQPIILSEILSKEKITTSFKTIKLN